MPPESIVLLLIGTWLLVAAAALWGMLRIARRHHHAYAPQPVKRAPPRALKPVRVGS